MRSSIVALIDVALFPGHAQVGFDVAGDAREFVVRAEALVNGLALLQGLLGFLLVAPEIGLGSFRFKLSR
jgi:hypothetical protein